MNLTNFLRTFNFGINSAAEEMEHALQTIPEKTNIADDILIFPVNTKQHSEIFAQLLKWCESKDITPNL